MIVSVNWLKKFTDIDGSIDELVTLIGARLVEIEEVIDLGERYKEVIVAKVVKVEKHPDADKLSVVHIDDGGVREGVERLENGLVQVVCGAPNVREGMTVAWLPPGATVPSSFTEKELFVLDARQLRGVLSNGMLASAQELGLSDDHNGILEIDVETQAGESFAKLYDLDDYLLDIENKSLTHRPDCFGLIGFAREVAAIQGKEFRTPDWLASLNSTLGEMVPVEGIETPTVTIDNPEICARYQAVVLTGVDAEKQSPIQLQSYLSRVGMRPISAIVDVTNYLMILTGQPLHAFDYDKFVKVSSTGRPDITVRESREGEKLCLLDGREITLSDDDILICAGETPVGLAGAMGGNSTEVDSTTKNILLESATFDLYRLRTTQMRHAIFSEAITRFTKGQSAAQTAPVLAEAVRLFSENAGGQQATEVIEQYPGKIESSAIKVSLEKINSLLGTDFTVESAAKPLRDVNFEVRIEGEKLIATPPYWRADIHIPEDIIEEIGRLHGFDEITPVLPNRDFTAVKPSLYDQFRTQLRQRLVRAGANEVLTYSFVHGDILKNAGQNIENAYRITNAISPDLQYYRVSLTPSLLDKVNANIRQRFDSFALFEVNQVHLKEYPTYGDEEVPEEFGRIALTLAANKKAATGKGAAYYEAKKMLEYMVEGTGLKLHFRPIPADMKIDGKDLNRAHDLLAPFERKRSAFVFTDTNPIGVVGEYKKSVTKKFKLPEYAAGFEISDRALLLSVDADVKLYSPLSRFPGTEQDICIQVAPEKTYAEVVEVAKGALADETIEWHITPVDIYQPESGEYKNITIRVSFIDHEKTITTDEASIKMAYIAEAAREKLNATII